RRRSEGDRSRPAHPRAHGNRTSAATSRGRRSRDRVTTLDVWIDRLLACAAAERGFSPHTVAAYARDLARFAGFAEQRGIRRAEQLDVTLLPQLLRAERPRGRAP